MRNDVKNDLILMFKGFIIGSSMSVPGISGGTMAILLGIYDKLISSISNYFKDIKGNTLYLSKALLGSFIGIGSLAFVIQWLLNNYPMYISFFFLGAVIGGVPALLKKTQENTMKISSLMYILIGLMIVISISFIPTGNFSIVSGSGFVHYLMVLVTGIIIALALILPGISTSHMLLVMGMYETLLKAITTMDIVYIGVLGISTVIGVFLITKPIEWTMNTYTKQTYFVIIGFVLGSTAEIFSDKILPAIPINADSIWWISSILISMITFALGFRAISSLSRFSNN
jgi:putative membrane protein